MKLVDQLFEFMFKEKFEEEGGDSIDFMDFEEAVNTNIEGDAMQEPLLNMFNPMDHATLTEAQIREGLSKLVRGRVDDFREQ